MKKKTLSKLLTLVLILSILLSMTGCEALDYRKAVEQYNTGNFDAAAQSFAATMAEVMPHLLKPVATHSPFVFFP